MTVTDIVRAADAPPSGIIIQNVLPQVDGGRYPIKREVGDVLEVTADIFKDGHDKIAAVLKLRQCGQEAWQETEMRFLDNDRWAGSAALPENTRYDYTVEAFTDRFGSWVDELQKKVAAGLDVASELLEGRRIVVETADEAPAADRPLFEGLLAQVDAAPDQISAVAVMLSTSLQALMQRHRLRHDARAVEPPLQVIVDRVKARYAAWYELFPRSAGIVPGQSGTFDDVIRRLPAIQAMGFDVLYFPPIHPIGHAHRKGPNNTLIAGPNDPGVPYAIGNEHGGHDAIEPSLGTFDDFRRLVAAAADHGFELVLDFAIQCSPDHPWVKDHPEWFHIRPDGSIKYAENPPKKYEDIYPINFHSSDWKALWAEMKRIVLFWVDLGVKMFRVDNPHTKPFAFWEWLIADVQRDHPDVVFLAEAFTRPKVMKTLAKSGFSQSYTYFTWRNFKQEIQDYFTELTQSDVREYMRGNLFPNTPDILPFILQQGGQPAFKMRLLLAATLSSVYGMYSGYELCENTPVPGKEEYLNSEKYEYKVWDWDRPGNIIDYVTRINAIRREHPALHEYDNLRFFPCDDDNMLCYGKTSADGKDTVIVVVNLDPFQPHETMFHLPLAEFGIKDGEHYQVSELITGQNHFWTGGSHHVFLDPAWQPGLVYAIKRWAHVDHVDPSG